MDNPQKTPEPGSTDETQGPPGTQNGQKGKEADGKGRPRPPAPVARPPPSGYKTQLCRFFQRSTCRYSREECPFAHGDEDLLEPEPGTVVGKPHPEETWQPPPTAAPTPVPTPASAPTAPTLAASAPVPAPGRRAAANAQRSAGRGANSNPQARQVNPQQPPPHPPPQSPAPALDVPSGEAQPDGPRGKRAERGAARRGGRRGSLDGKPQGEQQQQHHQQQQQPQQPHPQPHSGPAQPPPHTGRREPLLPPHQHAPQQPPSRPPTQHQPEHRREPVGRNRGGVTPNGEAPHTFGGESTPCRHYSKGCPFVATKGDMAQHLRECPFELCKDIIKSGAVDPLLKYFRKQIAERDKLIEQLQNQLANTCTEDEEQEGMLPEQVELFKQRVHEGVNCMHITTIFSERWPDSDWSCFAHHVSDSDLSYVYDGYSQWVWKGLRYILIRLEKGPA